MKDFKITPEMESEVILDMLSRAEAPDRPLSGPDRGVTAKELAQKTNKSVRNARNILQANENLTAVWMMLNKGKAMRKGHVWMHNDVAKEKYPDWIAD